MSTKPHGTDTTSALILGLEAEATFVDKGKFSVDWPRAVQLMGSHALRDPAGWLSLVVQSGVLLGATVVDISFGKEDCQVDLKGVELSVGELSDLWAMLDLGADTRRQSALYKLALALATLLTWGVKSIEIEIPGHTIKYAAKKHSVDESRAHLDRTRMRVVFDDASDAIRSTRVTSSILTRCVLSETNISFDGESKTVGWHAIFDQGAPRTDIHDSNGTLIGTCGFRAQRATPATLLVLVGGLRVEEVPLPDCDEGFAAVVDCDLPVDLSQQHLVRGERFDEVIRCAMDAYAKAPSPSPVQDGQRISERPPEDSGEKPRAKADVALDETGLKEKYPFNVWPALAIILAAYLLGQC